MVQTGYIARRCAFGVALLFALAFPHFSYAQNSACDADYYKSLEARAWMEAQREIEQNQNLIVKPDSVLEYTCFDLFGAELAQHAIDMFSETTRWGTILPPDSMDNALTKLVGTSLQAYQKANFDHKSLGGRGIDKHKFSGTIKGGSYTCKMMNDVWQEDEKTAKCYNFQKEPHDAFFTFRQHESEVVRQLPEACAVDDRWKDNNLSALGKAMDGNDGDTPWDEDREFEFLDVTKSCEDSPTIETGIQVTISKGNQFAETICLIPGCYYDGATCKNSSELREEEEVVD